MTYNSLKTLPIVTFFEIIETNNLKLLSDTLTDNELVELWSSLYNEFNDLSGGQSGLVHLSTNKKVKHLNLDYVAIQIAVEGLRVGCDLSLVAFLKEQGFFIKKETLQIDLDKVESQAKQLLARAKHFEEQLPKEKKENKTNIYDALASYSTILGFDLDYEKVTVIKFVSLQKQVKNKIKSLESNG